MKARTIVPLIVGLGVGIFAIKMGIDLVQEARSGQGGAVDVVVSARSIGVATRVTEAMLSTKSVPESLKPRDAFVDKQKLVGRVTAMSVTPGVPITRAMLAPPGSEPGLRAKIPAGFRAVSISVNEESAVAGFLTPGSRVDVFAGGGRKGGDAQLILSDVEVGAVGQSLSEVSKDGRTVRMSKSITLFLRPEQVKILHKHAGSGRKGLRLALRGNSEESEKQGNSFWMNALANAFQQDPGSGDAPEEPTVLASARRRHVVEVVRGRDVERLVFVVSDVAGEYTSADDPPSENEWGKRGFDDTDDSPSMEMNE